MARWSKVGDLVEISTANGLAYALVTHQHLQWGTLLRVLEGQHKTRPANISTLATDKVQFSTFFPLNAAIARKLVSIVGNVDLPKHLKPFPIFRNGVAEPATKKVQNWWLWDGKREWPVGQITPEQHKMPIRQIVNDTMLRSLIERKWTEGDSSAF